MTLQSLRRSFCWLFAPVATSVKGVIDRTDWRPIIAKIVVQCGVAGAGFYAALKDPEVMTALAFVLIAAVSGALEAVARHQMGPETPPQPSREAPKEG